MWRYISAPLLIAIAAVVLLFAPWSAVGSSVGVVTPPSQPRILSVDGGEFARFRAALDKTVHWDFRELPLRELVALITKDLQCCVVLDEPALTDASIGTDTLVTCPMPQGSARAVLKHVLQPHGLAIVLRDECLVITTQEMQAYQLETRIYPVIDLVRAYDDKGNFHEYDALIEAITSVVQPNTWKTGGTGEGGIEPFPASGALLITQGEEQHREVEQMLALLRQTRREQGLNGPFKSDIQRSSGGFGCGVGLPGGSGGGLGSSGVGISGGGFF